jgi:NMD protein affecting ribosome stability and mRNA decay
MKQHQSTETLHPGQHIQMMDELVQDPYLDRKKLPEPSTCTDCGATYCKGHWKWEAASGNAHSVVCPACKRIRDNLPAGYVSIQGAFAHQHKDEILSLVRHFADREKSEHPLKRIISITDDENGQMITTTDIHLARSIGDALHNALKGNLEYHYNHAEYLLRVRWER